MTADTVVRWLEEHAGTPPDSLLHPADVFPLATISNPSTDSDIDSDGDGPPVNIAALVHPPHVMGDLPTTNNARRRSSSLVGASVPSRSGSRRHRKRPSDNILEEGEDTQSESDSDSYTTESDSLELDSMSGDGLEDDEETGLTGRDRRRRRRRKRRNTLLDQRIVQEVELPKAEKLANRNLTQSMLINAALIGLW
jgi:solute carrier family 35, member C2